MKVQIYEHVHPADARASAAAGADFIGVKPGERNLTPGEVTFAQCRAIYDALPADADCWRVALTVSTDMTDIADTVRGATPDVIHLSGDVARMPPVQVENLRRAVAPVKVMLALPVVGADAVATALRYRQAADFLLLDTPAERDGIVGATGIAHDWAVSAAIVRRVHIPVILAGGLRAGNVQAAIRQVRPWGVDSFTHTNRPASRRKDAAQVTAFVANAKACLA